MAEIVKPNMNLVWASGGAIIAPSNTKIQQGWTAEIPPHQWENWEQNRQDSALLYLMQKGIPEWDATTEYWANRSFVQRNGNLYKAIRNNTNADPLTAGSDWTKAIPSATTTVEGTAIRATSAEVIAGTNDTKFVTSKGLQDKLDSPTTGYLRSSNNLSDVTNADTARQNIGVRPATNALAGLIRINTAAESTARTSDAVALTPLGLARNITTSNADVTAGRILKVGDIGSGTKAPLSVDFNALPSQYPYSGSVPVVSIGGSTNKPPRGDAFYIEQYHYRDFGDVTQLMIPYRSAEDGVWLRNRVQNGWSNYVEFYTTANFNPNNFAPSTHTHTISQIDGLQAALNAKQNNIGYTPANKAGDTFTGDVLCNTNFRAMNRVIAGNPWQDWTNAVMIEPGSVWWGGSGYDRYRFFTDNGSLSLSKYTGSGNYVGNIFSIAAGGRVLNFQERPTASGRAITLAGNECSHTGQTITITLGGTGTFYAPSGYVVVGFQTNANSDIRYFICVKMATT